MAKDVQSVRREPVRKGMLVDRTLSSIHAIVTEGRQGFGDALKQDLFTLVTHENRAALIGEFIDRLHAHDSPIANQLPRLREILLLHLENEIANQESRAQLHADDKSGIWSLFMGASFTIGLGIGAAFFWMPTANIEALIVSLSLLCASAHGFHRRRKALRKEQGANQTAAGLRSLKSALERRQ